MNKNQREHKKPNSQSRRTFIQNGALVMLSLKLPDLTGLLFNDDAERGTNYAKLEQHLNQDWYFGGKIGSASIEEMNKMPRGQKITLPHCVNHLSWQNWDVDEWQALYIYKREFVLPPEFAGMRVFLHFDRVMVGAIPYLNGQKLPEHYGGYLPFSYEITDAIRQKNNLLIAVDSRWSNVPPQGAPVGPKRVDYLEPGGITGDVRLVAVPRIFIQDVFAKPLNVLDKNSRKLEIDLTINNAGVAGKAVSILAELSRDGKVVSRKSRKMPDHTTGITNLKMELTDLTQIDLWHFDHPNLYILTTTLVVDGRKIHNHRCRIGFREARFEINGFYLNGKKERLFGLNRHEIYPYTGFAMPERVMRQDASILKHDLNCNAVRCSHYPQSEAFLDACDELGLMVWEEIPGWGYLGDEPWKEALIKNVEDMILRDRNHPSIIIWGTRVNESANDKALYKRTKEISKRLDGTRPSSGSMTPGSRKNWEQEWDEDVFAYDDYHADPDGSVGIEAPVKGFPYMLAEVVGQFNYKKRKNFDNTYKRTSPEEIQMAQAVYHAQAHQKAGNLKDICGVIAWCAFDYSSLVNSYNRVKYPGIADVFRLFKPGANFYRSQCDPAVRPVILPNFYWGSNPGWLKNSIDDPAIFSNCDTLKVFVGDHFVQELHPDSQRFSNIKYPPFFVKSANFFDNEQKADLHLEGYHNNKLVSTRLFSADTKLDKLYLKADEPWVLSDGRDAVRVRFGVCDRYGNDRGFGTGIVGFNIDAPGEIIGDNPFDLSASGGVAAIWVRARSSGKGVIRLVARHDTLGEQIIQLNIRPSVRSL